MSLSETLFDNLIKDTEERAIKIKYLCPKTGIEKLKNQNVVHKVVKNSKITKNEKKNTNVHEADADPLDPLSTSGISSSDLLPLGSSQKNRGKRGNQKLFENSVKITASNLSTDELEDIVFSAKDEKNDTKKSKNSKNKKRDLTVPPLKIKLGRNKTEVVSGNRNEFEMDANSSKSAPKKRRTNELELLLGESSARSSVSSNSKRTISQRKILIDSPIEISDSDSDGGPLSDQKPLSQLQNSRKRNKNSNNNVSRISKHHNNSKNYKRAIKLTFGKNVRVEVKRLSITSISRMAKINKRVVEDMRSKNTQRFKSKQNSKPKSLSFIRETKNSKFSSPIASSSPIQISNRRVNRSLGTPVTQNIKRKSNHSPNRNSRLFFKLNTSGGKKQSTSPNSKGSRIKVKKSSNTKKKYINQI